MSPLKITIYKGDRPRTIVVEDAGERDISVDFETSHGISVSQTGCKPYPDDAWTVWDIDVRDEYPEIAEIASISKRHPRMEHVFFSFGDRFRATFDHVPPEKPKQNKKQFIAP